VVVAVEGMCRAAVQDGTGNACGMASGRSKPSAGTGQPGRRALTLPGGRSGRLLLAPGWQAYTLGPRCVQVALGRVAVWIYNGIQMGSRTTRAGFGAADGTTRTVAYIRVSTDKQADKGVSLEAQEAQVRQYAQLYSLDLVWICTESGSAKTLQRPGLGVALAMLKAGEADALLVTKLDRLTRSVRDLGDLVEEHFLEGRSALLSVSEQIDTRTAGGRLVLNVLCAVSQWEREAIGERTSVALRHKASRGEYTGGPLPFGLRRSADGLHVEPEPLEQAVLGRIERLRAEGASVRAIVRRLNEAGVRCRGSRWHATTVQRIIKRHGAKRRAA
jgi:site-specific DNA recombinase